MATASEQPGAPSLDATQLGPADPSEAAPRAPASLDATAAASRLDATLLAPGLPPPRDAPPLLTPSSRLGRFVVLRKLGEGGMGTVYAAYDEELGRKLAVKLLHGRAGGTLGRGRLLREAQAMARLSHPNVVQIYEVGEHGPDVFVAMEFVDGDTLEAWQHARPRDPAETLAMYCQAGQGLAAAHAAGLVHRDFKPENVLVGADGRARVGDFGLARARGTTDPTLRARMPSLPVPEDSHADTDRTLGASEPPVPRDSIAASSNVLASPLTATGALLGTPAFMSPEQFHGARIDAASDQFSFCAALFAALYGQRAFAGDSLAELMLSVTSGALVRPPAHTGVPARLLAILQRGLATDPRARWPTMDALLAQLAVDPTRDGSSAPRERRRIALFMFPTVAVIATYIRIRQGDPGTRVLDPADSVLPILLAFLMIVVATFAFRRRLWPHPFHRNVMVCSLLILGHSLALRLALVPAGLSYDAITQVDMLVHPFVCIAAGWFVARWFYLVAAVPLVGGIISLFVPAWTNTMAAVLFPAQGLLLIYLWTRDAARQRAS